MLELTMMDGVQDNLTDKLSVRSKEESIRQMCIC